MTYKFISNIPNFSSVSNSVPWTQYDNNTIINFIDKNNIKHNASFLMIRSRYPLLVELIPSSYCVYIQSDEYWSVDSIGEIEGIKIKTVGSSGNKPNILWMAGYK